MQQQQQQQMQSSNNSSAIPIGSSSNTHTPVNANTQSMANSLQNTTSGAMQPLSGSPPQGGRISPPLQTPPSSASSTRDRMPEGFGSTPTQHQHSSSESVELQVDYWPIVRPGEHSSSKDKGEKTKGSDQGGKNSIKSTFRNLQVWRLPQNAQLGELSNGLTVSFATKEKKQKQSK